MCQETVIVGIQLSCVATKTQRQGLAGHKNLPCDHWPHGDTAATCHSWGVSKPFVFSIFISHSSLHNADCLMVQSETICPKSQPTSSWLNNLSWCGKLLAVFWKYVQLEWYDIENLPKIKYFLFVDDMCQWCSQPEIHWYHHLKVYCVCMW